MDKLIKEARAVQVYYSWRPSSLDPGDEHVIDCALNGGAVLVTLNLRDFRLAVRTLGLTLLSPVDFVTLLTSPDAKSPK